MLVFIYNTYMYIQCVMMEFLAKERIDEMTSGYNIFMSLCTSTCWYFLQHVTGAKTTTVAGCAVIVILDEAFDQPV